MVKKTNKKTEELEGGFRLFKRTGTKKVNTNEEKKNNKENFYKSEHIKEKKTQFRIEIIREKIEEFNNSKFCIKVYDEQNEKSEYYLIKIVEGYSKPHLYSLKNLNVLIDMKKKKNYNIVGKIDDTNYNDIKIVKLNDNDINLINFMIKDNDYKQIGLKIEQQPQPQQQTQQQTQPPKQLQQGGKNSQYIMTKQGKRKIHVGKRGGKYYIMNKKKVYVK